MATITKLGIPDPSNQLGASPYGNLTAFRYVLETTSTGAVKGGDSTAAVASGDTVKIGQPIAKVGLLVGIGVPSAMLHLEMYKGDASGPLSQKSAEHSARRGDGVPFMRRADLIDPTPFLNDWKTRLATP